MLVPGLGLELGTVSVSALESGSALVLEVGPLPAFRGHDDLGHFPGLASTGNELIAYTAKARISRRHLSSQLVSSEVSFKKMLRRSEAVTIVESRPVCAVSFPTVSFETHNRTMLSDVAK